MQYYDQIIAMQLQLQLEILLTWPYQEYKDICNYAMIKLRASREDSRPTTSKIYL